MIEHINILKEIVENLVHTVEVNSVINDVPNNTSTLDVCFTYYLNDNIEKVEIDGIVYEIVSFIINEELVLTPKVATDPLVDESLIDFEIDAPRWYNGTPIAVAQEMELDRNKPGFKGPYIYLREPFKINGPEDEDSSLVRSTMTGVNMFFIDRVREEDWITEVHYEKVIYPQNNELDFVFRAFKKRTDLFAEEFKVPDITNVSDWGKQVVDQGGKTTILSNRLSGVMATFEFPFIVDPKTCCNGKTQKIVICKPGTILLNALDFGDVDAAETKVIQVLDQNDDPDGVKELFLGEEILRTSGGGAPLFISAPLIVTGQITPFRPGDDGSTQRGRSNSLLSGNNPFGNTNRFTDILGTQVYTNDIVIDWSTRDAVAKTQLGIYRVTQGPKVWNNQIDDALLLVVDGFAGWALINETEISSILRREGLPKNYLNYAPFNIAVTGMSSRIHTGTKGDITTRNMQLVENGNLQALNKTSSSMGVAVRIFTDADLGL